MTLSWWGACCPFPSGHWRSDCEIHVDVTAVVPTCTVAGSLSRRETGGVDLSNAVGSGASVQDVCKQWTGLPLAALVPPPDMGPGPPPSYAAPLFLELLVEPWYPAPTWRARAPALECAVVSDHAACESRLEQVVRRARRRPSRPLRNRVGNKLSASPHPPASIAPPSVQTPVAKRLLPRAPPVWPSVVPPLPQRRRVAPPLNCHSDYPTATTSVPTPKSSAWPPAGQEPRPAKSTPS